MQIHFERLTDQLYIRHEIFRAVTRSIFAAFPGDLSVQIDANTRSKFCDFCLSRQDHSLALHNSRLRMARDGLTALKDAITERTLSPDARRTAAVISALPWPIRRSPRA